ncbi:MAG: aldehyde ferredoxin oxidoreductase family protein [bacterium]|jgi:aldehyde:ferredoxin oxidoreductase
MNGYGGKILRIDLTAKKATAVPLPEDLAREYLGSRGVAARLLYDEIEPGADPLGDKNKVLMASGPLSGILMPASGKVTFAAKSPATGGYGDSNMGGMVAAEMKYAGYDVIILEGTASEPSVIVIDDAEVKFISAAKYWGKGAIEAEKMLKEDLGEDFQIVTIGPAGEKKVYFACVSHDFGRQAGRTGIGAVLGSKQVKAIAVRGTGSFPLADPEKAVAKGKEMYEECFANPAAKEWQEFGTPGVVPWVNEVGAFPTKNFWTTYFDKHEALSGPVMRDSIVVTDKACFGCPAPCGKYSHAKSVKYDVFVEGPEYETSALIGGNCELSTIEDVAYGNYLCDQLGLDTISGGNVVAFALECFEKGIITKDDVDGRELKFRDIETFQYLVEKISAREGIGDILADGVKAAAAKLGGGSEKFAIHVKGLEWSGYEARYAPAMMLAYMTCDVGAHHNRAWAITHDVAVGRDLIAGKASKVIELQHIRPMFDMLGACRLLWVEIGFPLDHYPEILQAVTGYDYDLDGLLRISEKVWNLTRAFTIREYGKFDRTMDYPPARFYEEPIPTGPSKGHFIDRGGINALLDEYYGLRGWDNNGIPTTAKLRELGLDFLISDMEAARGK